MTIEEIFYSVGLFFLPVVIWLVVALIFRKTKYKDAFYRVFYAFLIFWVMYLTMPSFIFHGLGVPVNIMYYGNATSETWTMLVYYTLLQSFYALEVMLQFPLFMFPFSFLLAPLFSILILAYTLRGKGLKDITFWLDINEPLFKKGWQEEKDLLKLLIALLPVSLYVLITILTIFGVQENPTEIGTTTFGWVLEIYLLYLLSFLTGVHILASARVYHHDRFIGDTIRKNTFNTMLSIGIVLSIMSMILFVQLFASSIYIFIYFSIYYIMVISLFILFFKVLERASLYIFSKIILILQEGKDVFLPLKQKWKESILSAVLATTAATSFTLLTFFQYWRYLRVALGTAVEYNSISGSPTIELILFLNQQLSLADLQNIIQLVLFIGIIYYLALTFKIRPLTTSLIAGVLRLAIDISFLKEAASEIWITSVFSIVNLSGLNIYFVRFAYLPINIQTEAEAYILAPYSYLSLPASIVVFSILSILLSGKALQVTTITEDKRIRYICLPGEVINKDYLKHNADLVIVKAKSKEFIGDNEDEKKIFDALKDTPMPIDFLKKKLQYDNIDVLINALLDLYAEGYISFYDTDLRIEMPSSSIQGIYVVLNDGRAIFSETFGKIQVEPLLISGMLSAITSFVKETTRSQQFLQTIDHGDVAILIEYSTKFFVTLLANRETPELRLKLREFVKRFEAEYGPKISETVVNLAVFRGATKIVHDVFAEEISVIEE